MQQSHSLAQLKRTSSSTARPSSSGGPCECGSRRDSVVSTSTSASSRSLPSLDSSRSTATPSPMLPPLPSLSDDIPLPRRYTVASTVSHSLEHADYPRSKSYSFSGSFSGPSHKAALGRYDLSPGSTPTLMSAVDWSHHLRRGSGDSSRSSQSSVYGPASYAPVSSSSNALQFQPIPQGHFRSPFAQRPMSTISRQSMSPSPPIDFQSPFGVLIADSNQASVPPADPQRIAILRGLRPSSSHASLSSSNDESMTEPKKSFPSAKYECPYCSKRFNRPSSLKVSRRCFSLGHSENLTDVAVIDPHKHTYRRET